MAAQILQNGGGFIFCSSLLPSPLTPSPALQQGKRGEGKLADEELATINVTNIEVGPSMCELQSPLNLEVDFTNDNFLPDAVWEVKVPKNELRVPSSNEIVILVHC